MAEDKTLRLNTVLRELNISLDRAFEHLASKGFKIEAKPTTKISDDEYKILLDGFPIDRIKKAASKEIGEKMKEKETLRIAHEELVEKHRLREEAKKVVIRDKAKKLEIETVSKIDTEKKEVEFEEKPDIISKQPNLIEPIKNETPIEVPKIEEFKKNSKIDYYSNFDSQSRDEAEEMSEQYKKFYCLERSIRKLIVDVLEKNYGENWWELKVSDKTKQNVEYNISIDKETGYTERSVHKIDYTTFGDLRFILKNSSSDFSNCFTSQRALNEVMLRLNRLRGPIAHCTPFAEDEIIRLDLAMKDWFRILKSK